jgi:hypothetical protein
VSRHKCAFEHKRALGAYNDQVLRSATVIEKPNRGPWFRFECAVGSSAWLVEEETRSIFESFWRDCLYQREETSHIGCGDLALCEKTLPEPDSRFTLVSKMRSCDSVPVRKLVEPSGSDHSFYYRAYLLLKRFLIHER